MATKVYRSTHYSIVQNRCTLKSWSSGFQERPKINLGNFGTSVHPPPPSMATKVYRSTHFSEVYPRAFLKSWSSGFQERPRIYFGNFGTSVHPLPRRKQPRSTEVPIFLLFKIGVSWSLEVNDSKNALRYTSEISVLRYTPFPVDSNQGVPKYPFFYCSK